MHKQETVTFTTVAVTFDTVATVTVTTVTVTPVNITTVTVTTHSCPLTLGQILPVISFAWKMAKEKGKHLDVGRGPPNITSSGSFETVGLGILI